MLQVSIGQCLDDFLIFPNSLNPQQYINSLINRSCKIKTSSLLPLHNKTERNMYLECVNLLRLPIQISEQRTVKEFYAFIHKLNFLN